MTHLCLVDNKLLSSFLVSWVKHIFSLSYINTYQTANAFIMGTKCRLQHISKVLADLQISCYRLEKNGSVRELRNKVRRFAFGANKQGSGSIVQKQSSYLELCNTVLHRHVYVCACVVFLGETLLNRCYQDTILNMLKSHT